MAVSSLGATLQADLSSLAQLLNGTSSGSTLQARIGDPGSFANVSSMIGTSGAASLADALGNSGDGSSAINALLGGSDTTSPYGNIVGASGILNSIDGTTTDSGNIAAKLNTQTAKINDGATELSSSIDDIASAIGHTGTLADRIGVPTMNDSASQLSAVIGGNGATLAAQLGDPMTGDTGLSGLINAAGASNGGACSRAEPSPPFRTRQRSSTRRTPSLGLWTGPSGRIPTRPTSRSRWRLRLLHSVASSGRQPPPADQRRRPCTAGAPDRSSRLRSRSRCVRRERDGYPED